MSKAVAVDGDTSHEESKSKHSADTNSTGSWTNVSFTVTKGDKCAVDGKMVELEATAKWKYVGGTKTVAAASVAVGPFDDSATLTAGETRLKDKDRNILVDNDSASGST